MCIKKPKTPWLGASCISKKTKQQRVDHLVFADLSLEQRFITTSQGVINLAQIYSLNSAIPSFRNRIYSGNKVIPEIRHIYPWNRVIHPFRNRHQENKVNSRTSCAIFIQTLINTFTFSQDRKYRVQQTWHVSNSMQGALSK